MNTLEQLFDVNYTLGQPIPAHGNSNFILPACLYNYDTNTVILDLSLIWGDRQEFWNTYNTTRTSPWSQQGEPI
jgi:hypothetical protein